MCLPLRAAAPARKRSASSGMSSRRSLQRRQADRERRDAIVEVLAEPPLVHLGAELAVGGGDDADVDATRARVAERHHLALLQHAQQLRLHRRRHLADLVEQHRAARRRLEETALVVDRPGERATAVAEQLALEQRLRERGAVDGEKRSLGARAGAMDAARDQLLAGSGLALDENGDGRTRGALHEREDRHHARRASDDVGEALAPGEVTAERSHLRAQTLLRLLQAGIELRVLDGDRDATRERFEEAQVRVVERAAVTVHDLQHPDGAPPGDERGGQDAVGGAAGRAVDAGVEPGIRVDVVHPDRTAGLERRAGDPPVRREPEAGEARGDILTFRDDVREVELLLELVEEQHRCALGIEDFPHLAHDERDQLVDLDPAGERTAQVVEKPEAAVFIGENRRTRRPA